MIVENLYGKLHNFYNKLEHDSIPIKKTKVKHINLIHTHFISDKIRNYILTNLMYKFSLQFNIKNKKVSINYYSKNDTLDKILILNIVKRVHFMFLITNKYIDVNIYIYDTPFKKKFNCNSIKKCGHLTPHNVNSGLNYDNNIIIYRKEELLKLLLHELIHALDIDIKDEILHSKNRIFEIFYINKKNVHINESYVETWAIILNCFCYLYENDKIRNIKKFKKLLRKETAHSIIQSSKLCIYNNVNKFELLYTANKKRIFYDDTSNTFSYHFLKTINLLNLNKFLKLFMDPIYVMKSTYNYNNYISFLLNNQKSLQSKINYTIKTIHNDNLDTLTMSSI